MYATAVSVCLIKIIIIITVITRMVQLPAAAAIEYVAAVDACLIYIISSV